MLPQDIAITGFDYELPDSRIAKYPLEKRDDSKLLLYKSGTVSHTLFRQLVEHLPNDSLLVFNDSKVIASRLFLQKPTGGTIEVFALEPADADLPVSTAMGKKAQIDYRCLVGGAAKWKNGQVLQQQFDYHGQNGQLQASLLEKSHASFIIRFQWEPSSLSFVEVLYFLGEMPIPPYLNRHAEPEDAIRYQTVYARAEGSVAAPTAGLHFTPEVLQQLAHKGIGQAYTTLHVGAGTFLPVKSETMAGHQMHAEYLEADAAFLETLIAGNKIIPVGTTAMRTIETLYWMGIKAKLDDGIGPKEIEIKQWDAYQLAAQDTTKAEALQALLGWMKKNEKEKIVVPTSLLIAPGYSMRVCSGLITNFHQPKSTLLLLVSALVGGDWKRVYHYAMQNDFRFLSYGDSSLLLP